MKSLWNIHSIMTFCLFIRGDFKEKGFIYDNLIMYDIPKDNTTYLIKDM